MGGGRVPHLYLLLEVVPDPHAQLVELVPLLGQAHRAVLRVPDDNGQDCELKYEL